MKMAFKKIASLLMATALCMGLATTGFAANSSVTYEGNAEKFVFLPGSGYTETDLFDNFKNVMPGNSLEQKITVKNNYNGSDFVRIYLRAELHDESGNPLTYDEAYENTNGKDQANVAGERDETVVTMHDFLSQLSMKVYNGEKLIYDASPDELDGLAKNVLLGKFYNGESTTLTVELEVPITLGNEYANRVGEVDWVFLAEEGDDREPTPEPGPGPGPGPTPDIPDPDVPLSPVEPPVEPEPEPPVEIPEDPVPQAPKTGDETSVLPYVLLFAVGLVGMIVTTFGKRKKQE